MARITIEAAIETVEDAVAATEGGADRLELCAALDLGGLTPTLGQVEAVRAVTTLPMVVMLRPRGGHFVYSTAELDIIAKDFKHLSGTKPIGYVVGILNPDGTIHEDALRDVIARAAGTPIVFHRAFDRTPHHLKALDTLIELGVTRVLTSGGATTALEGSPRLAKLVEHAAGRIQILPCGRVRAVDAANIIQITGAKQLHGSFAVPSVEDERAGLRGYQGRTETSADEVRAVRRAVDTSRF